ncbi:hypothetical protein Dimus_021021 [Dionaea muscipula]
MAEAKKLKIVTFPWLAFGHLIPFLELSKSLAQRGHHILFVSTTRNLKRLPEIPQDLAPFIDLVELRLPRVDNLPVDAEATSDLPPNQVQLLKKAYDGLLEPMEAILEANSPDWVIHDFSCHWLPPVASKLGIKKAFFSVFMASALSFIKGPAADSSVADEAVVPEDLTVPPKWVTFPSKVVLRLHEAKKVLGGLRENASGVSDMFRLASVFSGCDAFFVRSCREVEGAYLDLLKEIHRKPVLPVGLLPPPSDGQLQQIKGGDGEASWQAISGWLDQQDERSVVYIAFGSEAKPTQEEFTELALGLERSGLPFFWVLIRRKVGDLMMMLPDGFEERNKGHGFVWTSWAPQVRILGHKSIGGFLTHSGWSSVIEALQLGLPLILFPIFGDQLFNARLLGEMMQVGYEVPRDEQDGSFTGDSVAHSLRLVVLDEGGKIYRDKAKEASALFGNRRLHGQYIDTLVEFLHR